MTPHMQEIASGHRFRFGENWQSFLPKLDRDRIATATTSLCDMLECTDLAGKRFLDIGSGSGLFSLAARRLGATVHSFDYDPASVACTQQLKDRFYPQDPCWTIEEGSVLDQHYLKSLGSFDVVYAWGVLHHTGDMWQAIRNATALVDENGQFFLGIYNDRGIRTKFWRKVKQCYCSGWLGRWSVLATFLPFFVTERFVKDILRLRTPWQVYVEYKKQRGMSLVTDWIDWLGGFPFEAASAGEVFNFCRAEGLVLNRLKSTSGNGIHEFVFQRTTSAR